MAQLSDRFVEELQQKNLRLEHLERLPQGELKRLVEAGLSIEFRVPRLASKTSVELCETGLQPVIHRFLL